MNTESVVKKSKWLSKHLRHAPEKIGLVLEAGGWVEVEKLLEAAHRAHFSLSREQLDEVVRSNDKQRFSFDESRTKIRANQGHSIEVDLQLTPQTPPKILYHGTGAQNQEIIRRDGLQKMRRHHVHLSSDIPTATRVGARHGKPIVFEVDAAKMHQDGFEFLCSENGVWLVEAVAPHYLQEKI